MFYFLLFALTSIIFFIAQKVEQKSILGFYSLSLIAVAILAFVAGCRDNTIGVDVYVYGLDTFNLAKSAPDFWSGAEESRRELIYYAINYFAATWSSKIGFSFFCQNFTQSLLVFLGLKHYIKQIPLWLSMLLYELYFYNLTLNLMCQGIAIGLMIFSLQFIEKRQFKKLAICALICFFIHKTSIIAYFTYFIIIWVMGKEPEKRVKYITLCMVSCIIGLVGFIQLLKLASSIPGLEHFVMYGGEPGKRSGGFNGNLPGTDIAIRLSMVLFVLLLNRFNSADKYTLHLFFLIVTLDLFTLFIGKFAYFATRLSYYFWALDMVLFLKLVLSTKLQARSRYAICTSFVLVILYCFVKWDIIMDYPSTYPYTSEFLNITASD